MADRDELANAIEQSLYRHLCATDAGQTSKLEWEWVADEIRAGFLDDDLSGGRRIAIIEQVGSRPTEHVVTLYEDSWFIEHPIGCTDQPCPYTEAAMRWDEPPLPHGRYEMEMNGDLINVMSDNEDLFRIVTPDPGESLRRCGTCHGVGHLYDGSEWMCPACDGHGTAPDPQEEQQ